MKKFNIVLLIIPFFILSCSNNLYLKSYEPIKVFLEQEKIDKRKNYILELEKVENKRVMSDFKEYKSNGPNLMPIVFRNDLEYKKMYHKYMNDTLRRYWIKDDFLGTNFIIKEKNNNQLNLINEQTSFPYKVFISEPLYYRNRRYLIFVYDIYGRDGGMSKLVFMKKEKRKWEINKVLSVDVFF